MASCINVVKKFRILNIFIVLLCIGTIEASSGNIWRGSLIDGVEGEEVAKMEDLFKPKVIFCLILLVQMKQKQGTCLATSTIEKECEEA